MRRAARAVVRVHSFARLGVFSPDQKSLGTRRPDATATVFTPEDMDYARTHHVTPLNWGCANEPQCRFTMAKRGRRRS